MIADPLESSPTQASGAPAGDLALTLELLRAHDRILIVSHQRPDGDCLGSTLGLYLVLKHLGKTVAAYNATSLTLKWDFVPAIANVHNALPAWKPELTVFVDCGSVRRVSDEFAPVGTILNIDHHLTNDRFGDINYIDIEACAVGEQIFRIMGELHVPLTPEIATSLYLSILTDTGGFRYSNTSARAFRIAGELVDAGADAALISQEAFESRGKGELALMARVLSNLHYECGDVMVWSELNWNDYLECGGRESEPEGLASDMRGVRGVEVSCLLHENEDGTLRAGFRGKGNIDCSAIAQVCGGGGHFNASGAMVKGLTFNEAKVKVLEVVRAAAQAWRQTQR